MCAQKKQKIDFTVFFKSQMRPINQHYSLFIAGAAVNICKESEQMVGLVLSESFDLNTEMKPQMFPSDH